jgi:serine/threonine protein kinase
MDDFKELFKRISAANPIKFQDNNDNYIYKFGNNVVKITPFDERSEFIANNLKMCQHLQFVPKYIDHGRHGKWAFIITEYCEGKLLNDVWDSLDEREKSSIKSQIDNFANDLESIECPSPWVMTDINTIELIEHLHTGIPYYCNFDEFIKCRYKCIKDYIVYIARDKIPLLQSIGHPSEDKMVFMHTDLNPWNIIVNSQSMDVRMVIDWESVGVYPKYYRYYKRSILHDKSRISLDILEYENILSKI